MCRNSRREKCRPGWAPSSPSSTAASKQPQPKTQNSNKRKRPSAPRATAKAARDAGLLDPDISELHVKDIVTDLDFQSNRVSDHLVGIFHFGLLEGSITQTEICNFKLSYEPNYRIRKQRIHEGKPCLGPDGLFISIRIRAHDRTELLLPLHGGDHQRLDYSPLTEEQIQSHPEYENWIKNLIWAGRGRYDSEWHVQNPGNNKKTRGRSNIFARDVPVALDLSRSPPAPRTQNPPPMDQLAREIDDENEIVDNQTVVAIDGSKLFSGTDRSSEGLYEASLIGQKSEREDSPAFAWRLQIEPDTETDESFTSTDGSTDEHIMKSRSTQTENPVPQEEVVESDIGIKRWLPIFRGLHEHFNF